MIDSFLEMDQQIISEEVGKKKSVRQLELHLFDNIEEHVRILL